MIAAADHPVAHVSWDDARLLLRLGRSAAADGGRMEYAARGGLAQNRFPWGNLGVDGRLV
jgi:formylglycine-generating enzyme required for sulfatase activity